MIRPRHTPLLLLAVIGAACGKTPPPPADTALPAGTVRLTPQQLATAKIGVDTARTEPVALPLTVPGTLVTPDPETARVGSIVEGRVVRVNVLPGDVVKAGQDLIHIHSHELATAQRDLATANAELAYARAAYERSASLVQAEAVSKEEVERRRMALDAARAEQRRAAEIVDHLHPSAAGDVRILAPRGGVVFNVHVAVGQAVLAGTPLADLGNATRLWVIGYVPENASATLRRGSVVELMVDALPGQVLTGRIVRVGGVVDSLRRSVEVRAELAVVPPGVRPGMFARLILPAGERVERVVLLEDAVQRTSEGEMVYVAEGNGLFRARPVKTTPLGNGRVAVEGLPPGFVVVTRNAYAVRAQLEARLSGAGVE